MSELTVRRPSQTGLTNSSTHRDSLKRLALGYGHSLSADAAAAWMSALGDLQPEALCAAVTRCLCERVYTNMPAPGEIRRMAIDWIAGETMNAGQAFDLVLKSIRCWGSDRKERAERQLGPSIWEVVNRLGGWRACCDFPSEQRNTFRAQFRDEWNRFNDQVRTRLRLPKGIAPDVVQPHEAIQRLADAFGA